MVTTCIQCLNFEWFKNSKKCFVIKLNILILEFENKINNIICFILLVIHTAAVEMLSGIDKAKSFSRKPDIMADAAYSIITKPADQYTGQFFIDDEILQKEGISDFDQYLSDPSMNLFII